MYRLPIRIRLGLACALGLVPLFAGAGDPKTSAPKAEYYKGKVVPLADLVAKTGSHLDADAAPHWLALAGDDGKVYPLVKDSGSRLFFNDPALLNRPMRLTGQLLPGSQILRVTAVHSYIKGQLHEVYYWCEICSIRRGQKNACECCGGPMELHEDPVPK
jgi:hypothetical protein